MTRNYRLMVTAALLGILPSTISISTASAAEVTQQKSVRSYFKKRANKTPTLSFQKFMRLSRADQLGYLTLIKQTLVEMDRHPKGRHASGAWDRSALLAAQEAFEKLLFCSAYANSDDKYCLNQGVVIPVDGGANGQTCTVTPDLTMHNFDTRTVLAPLGDDALKCSDDPDGSKKEMPCSPFFGFKPDGTLYCTDDNSTPTCNKLSQGDKGTFLDALTKCGKGTPPPSTITIGTGTTPVPCDALVGIYEDQSKIIDANCSEPQKYCSLVKKRVDALLDKLKENQETSEALDKINQARAAVADAGGAPTVDCPPGQKPAPESAPAPAPGPGSEHAGAQQPAPPPSSANAAECPNTKNLSDAKEVTGTFLSAIKEFLSATDDKAPQCINFTLPGDRRLNLDKKNMDTGLWLEVKKDGKTSKLPLTIDDYIMLDSFWHHVDPAKTPLAGLLDRTLPTSAPVVDPAHPLSKLDETRFSVPASCQKPANAEAKQACDGQARQLSAIQDVNQLLKGQPMPTRTWTTVDSTLLRFNTDAILLKEKTPDGKPLGMTVVDIKGNDDPEEHGLFPIVQQLDDPSSAPAPK